MLIILAGFVAAVAFHYAMGMYAGRSYPANTFLFDPHDAGNDFFNLFAPVKSGAPYSWEVSVYFPFAFLPLWLVRGLDARAVFALLCALLLSTSWRWIGRALHDLPRYQRPIAVGVIALLNYPVLFCLDRGNMEALVFAFIAAFLVLWQRGKWVGATLCLAAATAMKAYPAVFLVLLLARRQYRAVALHLAATLVFSVGSAALYPGGVIGSATQLAKNLALFKETYFIGNLGLPFNASYFGLLKIANVATHTVPQASVGRLLLPYAVFCALAFAALAITLIRREAALWKMVALLTFVMILFPQVSFDYKLIHVLLPLGLFLAASPSAGDRKYAVLFGLLLIPKAYWWLSGATSIEVLLSPLLMTIMAALLLRDYVRAPTPIKAI